MIRYLAAAVVVSSSLLLGCGDDVGLRNLTAINPPGQVGMFVITEVQVQYTEENGVAVVGGVVEFRLEGPAYSGGATLQNLSVVTDAQGIARTNLATSNEANFEIVVEAAGVLQPLRIPITVVAAPPKG